MYDVYIMSRSSLLSLRLEPKLKKQLDRLSRATSRSRSFIAAEAIREYVALNEWQIEEIKKGVAEADRGEFATEKDVKQVLNKWKRRGS
jgi:RHH-type transcriptional regulator, rel operon repressor / antitoxin RelB